MELVKNKVYRAQIIDYTTEGMGIARIDGRAVFVPHTAVGDQCDIRILKITKTLAWGRMEQLVVPSKHRISPACPVFAQCGGCCYQHITYAEELRAKEKQVRDALTRIGGQKETALEEILGAQATERYRNKAQYPVGRGVDGRIVTGFYRPHSHEIVPTEQCLIQSEIADKIAGLVREWMTDYAIVPYDPKTKKGIIRHIYVRTGEKSGETQLTLVTATRSIPAQKELVQRLQEAVPSLTGVLLNYNPREDNVILGDKTRPLWGEPLLEDRLCGNSFLLSPESFYQVNHAQAEVLYECALEFAALSGIETVLDLYCGAGTITLALAAHAKQVIGVEVVSEAVENARQNAQRNGYENVAFFCADAAQIARIIAAKNVKPDVLVVDPPRKGLDEPTRDAIFRMLPPKIVYISCAPATLARDIRELVGVGYRLVRVKAIDLFPRTKHVETVVLLSKGEINSKKVRVEFSLEDMDMSGFRKGTTYEEIKAYVLEEFGLKVSSLYIAQIKEKLGIKERECYNKPKSKDSQQPQCPPEKDEAIRAALAHFGMV